VMYSYTYTEKTAAATHHDHPTDVDLNEG